VPTDLPLTLAAGIWLLALLPACAPVAFFHRAVSGGMLCGGDPRPTGRRRGLPRAACTPAFMQLVCSGSPGSGVGHNAGSVSDVKIESYSADPGWPVRARRAVSLTPPVPPEELPPLIHHVQIGASPTSMRRLLLTALGLSAGLADELMSFGAVYLARPLIPGERRVKTGARPPGIRSSGAEEAGGGGDGGVTLSKPMRVLGDMLVPALSYVRVHEHPKRHLAARDVSWEQRIVHLDEDKVVVDKPPQVPTTPTVDNLYECAISQVSAVLGEPLLTTSRIDLATSGLVVFARNGKACADINAVFSSRRVSKVYTALIWGRVAEGEQRHWFQKGNRGSADSRKPTLLSAWKPNEPAPEGDWQEATLLVLKCEAFETGKGGGGVGVGVVVERRRAVEQVRVFKRGQAVLRGGWGGSRCRRSRSGC
jgi:hypothetical protein